MDGILCKPSSKMGKPSRIIGKRSCIMSKPSRIMGKPSRIMGKPSRIMGKRSRILGIVAVPLDFTLRFQIWQRFKLFYTRLSKHDNYHNYNSILII